MNKSAAVLVFFKGKNPDTTGVSINYNGRYEPVDKQTNEHMIYSYDGGFYTPNNTIKLFKNNIFGPG